MAALAIEHGCVLCSTILIFPYFHKSNGKIHFRFVIICEISGFKRLLINCIIDVAYKKKKTA
ncbi:MAG: hypothetical protein QGF31_07870, partial [Nitrospinota bacterium]|nr:hypothetical protein [Nitrospinota bacterium]